MQAVILAAGEGKRLRPLTEHIPKPMVRVGGKPILEYTLSILPPQIDEVILIVGYRSDVIKTYFGDTFGRLKLIYVDQPEPKGTGEALLRAKPFLSEDHPFLVIHADDLYHPDDLAACTEGERCILAHESKTPERFGVCTVDANDRLLGILEKRPNPPSNLVNIGVYLLDHNIFEIPAVFLPNGEHNLAEEIGMLAETKEIKVKRARFWHPIGYPEDVEKAEEYLKIPLEERIN